MPRAGITLVRCLVFLATAALGTSGCVDADLTEREAAIRSIVLTEHEPPATANCPMPDPGSSGPTGDTILLHDPSPRCRLVGVRTVTLSPSQDAVHPDPGLGRVLRHPRGILTNAAHHMGRERATLLVWDHEGRFLRRVGQAGEGPGEFSTEYVLNMYNGPRSFLYVNDLRRWTVFDQNLEFVRTFPTPRVGLEPDALIVTGDGGYVYAGRAPGADSTMWFHRSDSLGAPGESFGPVGEAVDPLALARGRSIALVDEDSFWAAPPVGAADGYRLEKWTPDGRLVRVIQRDPTWMHEPTALGPTAALPAFQVSIDEHGLLWVIAQVLRPGAVLESFENPQPTREQDQEREEQIETWIEVIDADAGRVVASALLPAGTLYDESTFFPLRFIPGRRESVGMTLDAGGEMSIEVFAWHFTTH